MYALPWISPIHALLQFSVECTVPASSCQCLIYSDFLVRGTYFNFACVFLSAELLKSSLRQYDVFGKQQVARYRSFLHAWSTCLSKYKRASIACFSLEAITAENAFFLAKNHFLSACPSFITEL